MIIHFPNIDFREVRPCRNVQPQYLAIRALRFIQAPPAPLYKLCWIFQSHVFKFVVEVGKSKNSGQHSQTTSQLHLPRLPNTSPVSCYPIARCSLVHKHAQNWAGRVFVCVCMKVGGFGNAHDKRSKGRTKIQHRSDRFWQQVSDSRCQLDFHKHHASLVSRFLEFPKCQQSVSVNQLMPLRTD